MVKIRHHSTIKVLVKTKICQFVWLNTSHSEYEVWMTRSTHIQPQDWREGLRHLFALQDSVVLALGWLFFCSFVLNFFLCDLTLHPEQCCRMICIDILANALQISQAMTSNVPLSGGWLWSQCCLPTWSTRSRMILAPSWPLHRSIKRHHSNEVLVGLLWP